MEVTDMTGSESSVTRVWLCMTLIKHQAGRITLVDSTQHFDSNQLRNSYGVALLPVVPFYLYDYSDSSALKYLYVMRLAVSYVIEHA